jgi:alcohol dehydrogenase class IV
MEQPMMNFEFGTATKIIFGAGVRTRLGKLAAGLGKRAFLTCGLPEEDIQEIVDLLAGEGVQAFSYPVQDEPTLASIQAGLALARNEKCDLVIGLGGGSALDTGKAVAVLLNNPGDLVDYLEVVGRGQAITLPGAPFIAVPTTAGTGSEVTSNAVIGASLPERPEYKIKVSLRSPFMLARLALVDPELTLKLPPAVTASTGLDALTQLIEPFVSNRANPLTDAICREGLRAAAISLRTAYTDGANLTARQGMSLASMMGGMALANAKLGAVHGFAAPLGGQFGAPHGAICACLLPLVMHTNLQALAERLPNSPVIERYTEIAVILTGESQATAGQGIEWVAALAKDLGIPRLAAYGMRMEDIPDIVVQAARASSMQGNPIKLTEAEMSAILSRAI